jgi:hypothetical protein
LKSLPLIVFVFLFFGAYIDDMVSSFSVEGKKKLKGEGEEIARAEN